jgi:hypothetical protein
VILKDMVNRQQREIALADLQGEIVKNYIDGITPDADKQNRH